MYYIVYILKFHSGSTPVLKNILHFQKLSHHVPCHIKEGKIRVAIILINAILNNFLQFNFSINAGIIRRITLVVDIYIYIYSI